MKKQHFQLITYIVLIICLSYSFFVSSAWLHLCYGLALFLFGMQCIEEGMNQAAGGYLQTILSKSTASQKKGLLFGMGATLLLQSSTLVSLLTIAFLSAGMIQLLGGIAIILGTNLGATSGIWLLALAGQKFSLSPFALPLLFFGVLSSFFGAKNRAYGRILLGVGFLFLGIDAIKEGFSAFSSVIDFAAFEVTGIKEIIFFFTVGLILTIVLQSTHATLMLALAALAGGQITLEQSFALAIGSNLGSSITTAVVGFLGSDGHGKRLALVHVIFNVVTVLFALLLFIPFKWLTIKLTTLIGFGDNRLIQLACFHTLINAFGVLIFWKQQSRLVDWVLALLPDKETEQDILIEEETVKEKKKKKKKKKKKRERGEIVTAKYLNDSALLSIDTTIVAVNHEMRHLARLTFEVICHALYIPAQQLYEEFSDFKEIQNIKLPLKLDVEELYEEKIKGVYSDLFTFLSKMEQAPSDYLISCQATVHQLVDATKDTVYLQKNIQHYLGKEDTLMCQLYQRLRRHLFAMIHGLYFTTKKIHHLQEWQMSLDKLQIRQDHFSTDFQQELFNKIRHDEITGWELTSLLNDLGYVSRVFSSLKNILTIKQDDGTVILPQLMSHSIEELDRTLL